MTDRTLTSSTAITTARPDVPAVVVRTALAIAGVLMCLVDFVPSSWLVVGIALSLAAALIPRLLLGWALISFLAAGQLAHHPSLSWRFLVLVAGLHFLHLLASLALELPWRGRIQLLMFNAPLRRFVVIQVPTQLLAVLALWLLAPEQGGHRPVTFAAVAVVGAIALVGVALLVSGHRHGWKD